MARSRFLALTTILLASALLWGQATTTPSAAKPAPRKGTKAASTKSPPPRPLEERLRDLDAIAPLFPDPETRGPFYRDLLGFVRRNLKLAMQAGYDANLVVANHAQADGVPRVYRITKGVLSHEPSERSPRQGAVELERFGHVSCANEQEASALGLSFFLKDAEFTSPTELRYTVISDPSYKPPPDWAHELTETENRSSEIVLTTSIFANSGFSSSAEPQVRTVHFNAPFNDKTTGYLSIGWMSAVGVFQLESNEIDLASVWKQRSAK